MVTAKQIPASESRVDSMQQKVIIATCPCQDLEEKLFVLWTKPDKAVLKDLAQRSAEELHRFEAGDLSVATRAAAGCQEVASLSRFFSMASFLKAEFPPKDSQLGELLAKPHTWLLGSPVVPFTLFFWFCFPL